MIEAKLDATGMRFAIVASRWNEFVTKQLADGAERGIRMLGGESEVVWVPGTWEIPIAALECAKAGYEGVVCVGCILQGATNHAQQLSNQTAAALAEIAIRTGLPVTWGVLTCATQEEAIERAGMKLGNKGEEAARAAIEMASLRKRLANAPR
jgi:6,7-dimethyl-8-ribityllumazine synthase